MNIPLNILRIMDRICSFMNEIKPVLLMVVAQVLSTGGTVLYKLAVVDGMSFSVIVAYRFIFSTAFIVPVALVLERKRRPKLNVSILFKAFLCSLFGGSLYQYLFLKSLALTSASFVTAICNLIPALTFILAISFGLEKLAGIWSQAGIAKVLGTLIGIGGAMILTFCKGFEIRVWSTNINLLHHRALAHSESTNTKTLFGCLLSFVCSLFYSMGLIIQSKMSEQYPCQYSSIALVSLMAAIESVVFCLCTEKDFGQWKLGLNIRLITVAYQGIVAAGLLMTLIFWCVRVRGPLFVSIFNPLGLLLVALAGSLVLEESLYIGSVIGAIFIVCGLYAMLWGKAKEMKKKNQLIPSNISGESLSTEIVINSDYTSKNNMAGPVSAVPNP